MSKKKNKQSQLDFGGIGNTDLPWKDDIDSATSSELDRKDGWHGKGSYGKCHEKHPELTLGGGVILGASCNAPRAGYDVYVGFDWGMKMPFPPAPWNPLQAPADTAVHAKFEIQDMNVPKDKDEFDRMVAYLIDQLAMGKRVHIGCIGGHGRTGLVLAVLVKTILGEEDAIEWVRTNHCKKAVETSQQVDWLHTHYGIKKAKASKGWSESSFEGKYGGKGSSKSTGGFGDYLKSEGGGMGMSGKSPNGKAIVTGKGGAILGEGLRLVPLDGPSRIFPSLTTA
ncbi:MAG TPA: hypothetical protein VGD46_13360 [Rhizobacter sp.]